MSKVERFLLRFPKYDFKLTGNPSSWVRLTTIIDCHSWIKHCILGVKNSPTQITNIFCEYISIFDPPDNYQFWHPPVGKHRPQESARRPWIWLTGRTLPWNSNIDYHSALQWWVLQKSTSNKSATFGLDKDLSWLSLNFHLKLVLSSAAELLGGFAGLLWEF